MDEVLAAVIQLYKSKYCSYFLLTGKEENSSEDELLLGHVRQGSLRHRGSLSSGGGGGLGPGGVYDGSGGGGGLGPGGVYDGSGGQPIYINEDRIDAISVQSNIFQKNVFQLFENFFFNFFHFFQFFQRFTVKSQAVDRSTILFWKGW